jgi:1-aminocyclopropane-1-carboxylate deaminase/D-cysteine desulfhydrase-like pyridoxal-dependent ACC family enzyme
MDSEESPVNNIVTDPLALTPCEQHDGRWYKRDDLFMPFEDIPLSGGKVRQAIQLLERRVDYIRREHRNTVLTATSIHSPQGLIIARVCQSLSLRCVVFSGTRNGRLGPMLVKAVATGAEHVAAPMGYENVLLDSMKKFRRDSGGYIVRFGINLEDEPDAIIGSTVEQCSNIPESVTTVVVPVGSGITAAGILLGLVKYRPDIKRIVLVQIAGYDRRDTIIRICRRNLPRYESIRLTIPYSRHFTRSVDGIRLDPVYEAKAHDWLLNQEMADDPEVLFWLVGDSTAVR